MARSPYDLLIDPHKTTLACPGGVVLGFGPGPGLRHAIFWNRVGSLFSCWRPAVAVLTLFDAADPHTPVPLRTRRRRWEPNLCTARYSAPGLRLEEKREGLTDGLRCLLKLESTASTPREWVLFFHGAAEQWPFFDYQAGQGEPQIRCEFDLQKHMLTLTQPHPHDGLPPLASIQEVTLARPIHACGFLQSEGELQTLWAEHGALASLRLRLGQVGGRYTVEQTAVPTASESRTEPSAPPQKPIPSITFTHRHPVYYFATRIRLEPGQTQLVSVGSYFRTDDAHAAIARSREGTTPDEWRRYLRDEVPQLTCSDAELTRYWYYVWYVLRANRTAPGAHVTHPFTAPSKYLYWGPWIWDGYFHVLGEMWLRDPEVAKDSIRAVLDMQFPNGYLPVCSGSNYRMCFHDACDGFSPSDGTPGGYASYVESALRNYREAEHPYEAKFQHGSARVPAGGSSPSKGTPAARDGRPPAAMLHNEKTQTPLITVAAWEYVNFFQDWDFGREVLPKLWAYEQWLWRRRTDKQGRFILWHGDESGWDDATRHYPVPAKPFDVQVHALMHRQALMQLAGCCDEMEIAHEVIRRAKMTQHSLRTYRNSADDWHYDFGAAGDGQRTGKRRLQIAPSGLFAMLVDQSPRVVDRCLYALQHGRIFNTPYPIPTLSANNPDYRPHGWGWNGPAWLQVNYFTLVGLLEAAEIASLHEESERAEALYKAAFALWEQTRGLIIRDGKPHSYELYDPESGTGMGCPDYSWQAMINHLIIRYFAGVGHLELKPALPPGMNQLAISNLPGHIAAVSIARERKHVTINLELAESLPIQLITGGLGEVTKARASGMKMRNAGFDLAGAYLLLPEPDHRRWEIIVTCR